VLLRGTSTMDIELVFAVLVVLTVVGIAIIIWSSSASGR
jgi:NitT/TauT family transport system permease protein